MVTVVNLCYISNVFWLENHSSFYSEDPLSHSLASIGMNNQNGLEKVHRKERGEDVGFI